MKIRGNQLVPGVVMSSGEIVTEVRRRYSKPNAKHVIDVKLERNGRVRYGTWNANGTLFIKRMPDVNA